MTIPSRLDRRDAPRPHHAGPCQERCPREPSSQCEGREGHDGPCMARVTVTWQKAPPPPVSTDPA